MKTPENAMVSILYPLKTSENVVRAPTLYPMKTPENVMKTSILNPLKTSENVMKASILYLFYFLVFSGGIK